MSSTRFTSSVVSYPNRGVGGSNKWRGNSGPGIVEQFLLTYHLNNRAQLDTAATVCDPMKGSDTTGDVCRQLKVPYQGFDLHEGFDAVRNDLLTALGGNQVKTVFSHPAYLGMVPYSGSQWGKAPHPADLSHVGTNVECFDEMLQAIVMNIARAVQPGGVYGLLVGNWRKNGRFYHMASHVIATAPDELCMEVIKQQHNVSSAGTQYSGAFVPTTHETLLVFKRAAGDSTFAIGELILNRLKAYQGMTWRNVILGAMRSGEATTAKELYQVLANHPRAQGNKDVYAKLRQTLNAHPEAFEKVARGKYAPVGAAA